MLTPVNFETVPLALLQGKGLAGCEERYSTVVLVVDSEPIIADTRAAILTNWGCTVLTAYDAASALEIASLIPPELLITDIALSQMNGVDLAIAIRLEVPDCRVILFSGQSDSLELIHAAEETTHEFTLLTKPFHPSDFRNLLVDLKVVESAAASPLAN